jgi:hypothetical protein
MNLLKNTIFIITLFVHKLSYANRYSEYQSDPNILRGATGSDDSVLATMVFVTFFGSFVVAYLFKREFYTPVKEVSIFILICIAITYFWAVSN